MVIARTDRLNYLMKTTKFGTIELGEGDTIGDKRRSGSMDSSKNNAICVFGNRIKSNSAKRIAIIGHHNSSDCLESEYGKYTAVKGKNFDSKILLNQGIKMSNSQRSITKLELSHRSREKLSAHYSPSASIIKPCYSQKSGLSKKEMRESTSMGKFSNKGSKKLL